MEETIGALNQKVTDMQQQRNTSMGARDLASIMETSNLNLVDILASQNKRA